MTIRGEETWIVTVKYKRNPNHDPRNKIIGTCQTSEMCSDSTGSHHCFLVKAHSLEEVATKVIMKFKKVHITRIELAKNIEDL